jgi:hypothetical protein
MRFTLLLPALIVVLFLTWWSRIVSTSRYVWLLLTRTKKCEQKATKLPYVLKYISNLFIVVGICENRAGFLMNRDIAVPVVVDTGFGTGIKSSDIARTLLSLGIVCSRSRFDQNNEAAHK